KEIINILCQQGVFTLKDAVVKVAEYLDISKNTVYMHIRNAGVVTDKEK
ncbi:helix-turn-helix domain-containing protein, partial [Lacrimispora sp.]